MSKTQNTKGELHPLNPHRGQYDFDLLIQSSPSLAQFVVVNKYGNRTVDFFDPRAVKALNCALLRHYYDVEFWDLPSDSLVPPIPGRADYIHYLSELIGSGSAHLVRCLDVGVGASCIYPILGFGSYGWDFVGSDVERSSLENSQLIVDRNPFLRGHIELRHQADRNSIFRGVISGDDYFDATMCNPPFHDSKQSAQRGTMRKLRNLRGASSSDVRLNFGGRDNELWCKGGERGFVRKMIRESVDFRNNCGWFTTLISNQDNIAPLRTELQRLSVSAVRVIEMSQGNKRSRILAWRF